VDKLCVDKFCVDKLCGRKLCVCVVEEEGGGRRAGGGGQEEKAGVQNQKQEPHTKMWGMISVCCSLSTKKARDSPKDLPPATLMRRLGDMIDENFAGSERRPSDP